jgi:hypothetical protein
MSDASRLPHARPVGRGRPNTRADTTKETGANYRDDGINDHGLETVSQKAHSRLKPCAKRVAYLVGRAVRLGRGLSLGGLGLGLLGSHCCCVCLGVKRCWINLANLEADG